MPKNLNCPNCEKPSIGYWQKQFLGPARAIDCSECGARISVNAMRFVPILLFIIATPTVFRKLGLLEYGFASYCAEILFLLLVVGLYQHYLVPLVVRTRQAKE